MIHGLIIDTGGRPPAWLSSLATGSVVAEQLALATCAPEFAMAGISASGILDPT